MVKRKMVMFFIAKKKKKNGNIGFDVFFIVFVDQGILNSTYVYVCCMS